MTEIGTVVNLGGGWWVGFWLASGTKTHQTAHLKSAHFAFIETTAW